MSDNLMPNEKYAETEQEEFDGDMAYDRMRDDDGEKLETETQNLINNLSTLPYYKHRSEGLAKDMIKAILRHLNLQIGSITQVGDFYDIELKESEE